MLFRSNSSSVSSIVAPFAPAASTDLRSDNGIDDERELVGEEIEWRNSSLRGSRLARAQPSFTSDPGDPQRHWGNSSTRIHLLDALNEVEQFEHSVGGGSGDVNAYNELDTTEEDSEPFVFEGRVFASASKATQQRQSAAASEAL